MYLYYMDKLRASALRQLNLQLPLRASRYILSTLARSSFLRLRSLAVLVGPLLPIACNSMRIALASGIWILPHI